MHPPLPSNFLSQNNEADDYDHAHYKRRKNLNCDFDFEHSKNLWLMMIYDKFGCSCNQVSFILVYIWM